MAKYKYKVDKFGSFLSDPFNASRESKENMDKTRRMPEVIKERIANQSFAKYILDALDDNNSVLFRLSLEETLSEDGTQLNTDLFVYNPNPRFVDLPKLKQKIDVAFGGSANFCTLATDAVHGNHLRMQISLLHNAIMQYLWGVLKRSDTLELPSDSSSDVTFFFDRVRYPLLVDPEVREAYDSIIRAKNSNPDNVTLLLRAVAFKQATLAAEGKAVDLAKFAFVLLQHKDEPSPPVLIPRSVSPRALLLSGGVVPDRTPSPFEESSRSERVDTVVESRGSLPSRKRTNSVSVFVS